MDGWLYGRTWILLLILPLACYVTLSQSFSPLFLYLENERIGFNNPPRFLPGLLLDSL